MCNLFSGSCLLYTSRPSVCNAAEKLLINKNIAEEFLPIAVKALREAGVVLRGDEKAQAIIDDIEKANDEDWGKEYLLSLIHI